jgi:RNA polymerase sigma factor (sigma-70 family)
VCSSDLTAILRHSDDAEEVVSATYAYAWANAVRYDSSRANPLGWLLMLCRSRALDRLRQRRSAMPTVDIDDIADMHADDAAQPDDLLSLLQQRSRIHAALATLTPERRKLISLAFLQGMTHQEIAQTTGIALGTVKSHVRRALTQLREALEAA